MMWLLYYVIACWCIAAVFAIWFWRRLSAEECGGSRAYLLPATCLTTFTAPIWVPLLAIAFVRCGRQVAHIWSQFSAAEEFRKTYHEYAFRAANFYQLPQEVRDWWDESNGEFFQNGFSMLSDYELRDEPYQMNDRFYWHDSGTCLGSATAMTIAGSTQLNYNLSSVLSNGAIVSTNTVEHADESREPDFFADKMQVTYLPNATVDELVARHCATVAEIAEQHGLSLLAFDAERHQELVIYEQRMFCGWLHRRGEVTEPPAPELPAAVSSLAPSEFLADTTREHEHAVSNR